MVEQKDISSPLLMEVPKSQLTVKQPMAKKQSKTTLEPPKRDSPTFKDKEAATRQ